MKTEDKVGCILLALCIGIFFWFGTLLFHYNHIYKVRNTNGISTSVYSDDDFEIGDIINYQTTETGSIEGHNPTWGDDKQGIITKILR